jgi:hypothetical protein
MREISAALFQGLLNLFSINVMGRGWRRTDRRLTTQKFWREHVSGDEPGRGVHDGPHENIAQLTDVPRPGILTEDLYNLRGHFCCRESFFVKQMTGEQR